MENTENVIEWFTGQHNITVSLSHPRYIKKVLNLAEKYPDKVKVIAENNDGTICAKLPIKALKLNISERNLTEEQREKAAERFRKYREENR